MMVNDFSQGMKTWHIILLQARDQWVIVFAWSFLASFRPKIFFDLLAIIWIVEWWDNIEIPDCPGFF